MPSQRVSFENKQGARLSGIMDFPAENDPVAFALFSHCFTCTKDLKAIVKISRGLARHRIGVLRFDFTGLGESKGEFADTNFQSNISDIQAAANWLGTEYQAPKILIGKSLGGAAMMAAANSIESAKGLVTLAAPSCTKHLAVYLDRQNPEIQSSGQGQVEIGGRKYQVRRQLLESLASRDLRADIEAIKIHHLVLHSPVDDTLEFRHAEEIFAWTGGPKSFVTIDGADHLLVNQPDDIEFVSDLIALWAKRFLD